MLLEKSQALLEQAAGETRKRIRRDLQRATSKVRPMLAQIEAQVFDSELTVKRLRRDCQIRDNSILTRFHAEIGLAPYAYITDCRMTTAARLLAATDLQIWKVASLVGYPSLPVFSRAFLKWAGVRPSIFRKQKEPGSRGRAAESPPAAPPAKEANRLSALLERLASLQEKMTQPEGAAAGIVVDGQAFERFVAEAVWRVLAGLDQKRGLRLVREQLRFSSPALFQLLSEKSREAVDQSPRRGVELAELALASLEGNAEMLGSDLPDYQAKGWAWLGNARRLALDFPGAKQALARSDAASLAKSASP